MRAGLSHRRIPQSVAAYGQVTELEVSRGRLSGTGRVSGFRPTVTQDNAIRSYPNSSPSAARVARTEEYSLPTTLLQARCGYSICLLCEVQKDSKSSMLCAG